MTFTMLESVALLLPYYLIKLKKLDNNKHSSFL
jgi:hypothetical protein